MGDIRIRRDGADRLAFEYEDSVIAEYVFLPGEPRVESPRPYFSPLRTLSGREVTGFRPSDHVWHKGLSLALPVINDEDFWGGPSYLQGKGYVQLPNNGSQLHRAFTAGSAESEASYASIGESLEWVTESGCAVIAERRTLSATVLDSEAWLLVFETELSNHSSSTLSLGSPTTRGRADAGYGGLFWRGPASFGGGSATVHTPTGSGTGSFGDARRGDRASWMALTGQHDSARPENANAAWSTVVMVDDHGNAGHPTEWFLRSEEYACLSPAPFFSTEYELRPGSTLALRYGVVIADGQADWTRASGLAAAAQRRLDVRMGRLPD